MIDRIDLDDNGQTLELLALQLKCSRIEADLAGIDPFPLLMESIQSVKRSGETFFGYRQDAELAGAVSYKRRDGILTVCRLMVEPSFFRKGIAGELLRFAQTHEKNWAEIRVSTATLNVPAVRLYGKHGFAEVGKTEIDGGISMTSFMKKAGDANLGVKVT